MKISARAVMIGLVVLVLATLAAGLLLRPGTRATASGSVAPGTYRLMLTNFPGGGLPVGLDIVEEAGGPAAYLVNGANRVRAERTTAAGRNRRGTRSVSSSTRPVTVAPVKTRMTTMDGTAWLVTSQPVTQ